jgi:hypothetical protein
MPGSLRHVCPAADTQEARWPAASQPPGPPAIRNGSAPPVTIPPGACRLARRQRVPPSVETRNTGWPAWEPVTTTVLPDAAIAVRDGCVATPDGKPAANTPSASRAAG